jgi:F-type H+-transporting ATPase subunit b
MAALGVNLTTLIVQLIAFAVFVLLFWKFALGPVTNMLDRRREAIRESMEAAQRIEKELAATQARNEEVLIEARKEAQEILASARASSEQTLARAREQTQVQADEIIEKARATIEAERRQAWEELRHDVADLAIAAATKIVRHELNPQEQARLIQETLAEASNGRARAQALD